MAIEQTTSTDRRVDILNNLVVRVTVLEEKSRDHIVAINHHDATIDKLIEQDHKLLTSLNEIASNLELATVSIGTKSDLLIKQFTTGFKVLSACTGALIFSVGAFYTYSKDLDAKYMPKFESLVRNTEAQKDNDEDLKNDLEKVKTLAQRTAQKKSVRASK